MTETNSIYMIFTIAFILFTSPFLASLVRLPTAPVEIVLGSFLAFLHFLNPDDAIFELMSEVGFYYLMFLAGTEVNLNLLLKLEKSLFLKGSIYLAVLYILSLCVSYALALPSIFIFIFSLISVGLIMPLFNEFGKEQKWLNLAMNIGILGELLTIVLLTIVAAVLENGIGEKLFNSVGLFLLFLVSVFLSFRLLKVIFWWHPEWKKLLVPKSEDKDEKDIRISMAIFFFMVALATILHLEVAFGAFLAGIFIATFFEYKEKLPHKLSTFGFGFLIPIFFIHVGSMFEVKYLLNHKLVLEAFLITIATIMIRFIASFVFGGLLKLKEKVLFALSHSMPLTLLIAIATLALQYKSIAQFHYYALILASLIEVIISMASIKLIKTTFRQEA